MSETLFSAREWMLIERARTRKLKLARRAGYLYSLAGFLTILLILVVSLEGALLYEVVDQLIGPIPGEEAKTPVLLFALIGGVMILAYHVVATQMPDHVMVRTVNRMVPLMVFIYMVGAGLVVAGVFYNNGAQSFFESADGGLESQLEGWISGSIEQVAPTPVIDFFDRYIKPIFPLIFVSGIGGVTIVNIFVGHYLLVAITTDLKGARGRFADAKDARKTVMTLKRNEQDYSQAFDSLRQIKRGDEEEFILQTAHAITGALSGPICIGKGWVAARRLRPGREDGLLLPGSLPTAVQEMEIGELEEKVRQMEKVNFQSIVKTIRKAGGKKQ